MIHGASLELEKKITKVSLMYRKFIAQSLLGLLLDKEKNVRKLNVQVTYCTAFFRPTSAAEHCTTIFRRVGIVRLVL